MWPTASASDIINFFLASHSLSRTRLGCSVLHAQFVHATCYMSSGIRQITCKKASLSYITYTYSLLSASIQLTVCTHGVATLVQMS